MLIYMLAIYWYAAYIYIQLHTVCYDARLHTALTAADAAHYMCI
jgi:hypothetical protein